MTSTVEPGDRASTCPACGTGFTCGVDRPPKVPCWCTVVDLSPRQLEMLARRCEGCLCPPCLETWSTSA